MPAHRLLFCALLRSALLWCTVVCRALLCQAVLRRCVLCRFVLCYSVLCQTVLVVVCCIKAAHRVMEDLTAATAMHQHPLRESKLLADLEL